MKIVHLVTCDSIGAGRAAIRISESVRKCGYDSEVLVVEKNTEYNSVSICKSFISQNLLRVFNKFNRTYTEKSVCEGYFNFDHLGQAYRNVRSIKEADVINLHWLNDGIWSNAFIRYLKSLNKPIVCTLHDMWMFTGGCHYDEFCSMYNTGCKCCPKLVSNRKRKSGHEIMIKKKVISELNIQTVGCSNWITNEFNNSFVGRESNRKCTTIFNPINTSTFHKMDKLACRRILGLPLYKRIVSFGARNSTSDKRKGFDILQKSISTLDPNTYELLVFGAGGFQEQSGLSLHSVGNIRDDLHLAMLYNASDCFVAPSLQENLANTVVESLACGTPVVAFQIGGMTDLIIHNTTGYLAIPYESDDLAKGIEVCSTHTQKMCEECIKSVNEKLDEEVIGEKYISLYSELIKGNGYVV